MDQNVIALVQGSWQKVLPIADTAGNTGSTTGGNIDATFDDCGILLTGLFARPPRGPAQDKARS